MYLVRPYQPRDVPAIAKLYYKTIRRVNRRDYTWRQVRAWAPRVYPDGFWLQRFQTREAFVAEKNGSVVGFCELDSDGHIDCFYVHHRWQARGVGSAMLRHILQRAAELSLQKLTAQVSLTAFPFFQRHAFTPRTTYEAEYNGTLFRVCWMEKSLAPSHATQAVPEPHEVGAISGAKRNSR